MRFLRSATLWCALALLLATPGAAQTRTIQHPPTFTITDLGRIGGASTLRDGSVAVLDEANFQVVLFDKTGKRMAAVGRRGAGPGEFVLMSWLGRCGSGDTVAVFDATQNRITRIANGRVTGTQPAKVPFGYQTDGHVSAYSLACSQTGAFALVGWPDVTRVTQPGPHRETVNVAIAKPGSPYTRLGTFPGPERYRYERSDGPLSYGKQVVVAVSPTRVYIGTADSFHVQSYDLDGVKRADLKAKTTPKRFDARQRAARLKRAMTRYANHPDAARFRTWLEQETLPEVVAAYDRFLLDDRNRLWVAESVLPTDTARVWWGFDEAGKPVGRIQVPAEFELYEITATTVLGKWTDEDGAESVHRFRLAGPAR